MYALLISRVVPVLIALGTGEEPPTYTTFPGGSNHPVQVDALTNIGEQLPPRGQYRGTKVKVHRDLEADRDNLGEIAKDLESNDFVPRSRIEYFAEYHRDPDLKCIRWLGKITSVSPSQNGQQITVRFQPELTSLSVGGTLYLLDDYVETYSLTNGKLTFIRGAGGGSKMRGAVSMY